MLQLKQKLHIFLLLLDPWDVIVSLLFAFFKATSLNVLLLKAGDKSADAELLHASAFTFWFAYKAKAVCFLVFQEAKLMDSFSKFDLSYYHFVY